LPLPLAHREPHHLRRVDQVTIEHGHANPPVRRLLLRRLCVPDERTRASPLCARRRRSHSQNVLNPGALPPSPCLAARSRTSFIGPMQKRWTHKVNPPFGFSKSGLTRSFRSGRTAAPVDLLFFKANAQAQQRFHHIHGAVAIPPRRQNCATVFNRRTVTSAGSNVSILARLLVADMAIRELQSTCGPHGVFNLAAFGR